MEAMRQTWSDDRLDALNEKVDERFDRVDRRSEEVDKRLDKVDANIQDLRREMNLRFDSIQRTMWQTGFVLTAAVLGVLATQL